MVDLLHNPPAIDLGGDSAAYFAESRVMRQRFRVVYWAVLALRREYSIMVLAVSNNNRTAHAGSFPETRPVLPVAAHRLTARP